MKIEYSTPVCDLALATEAKQRQDTSQIPDSVTGLPDHRPGWLAAWTQPVGEMLSNGRMLVDLLFIRRFEPIEERHLDQIVQLAVNSRAGMMSRSIITVREVS
jgi:hypothetical protein